jgi:ABC-type sugar transport system permease subunit
MEIAESLRRWAAVLAAVLGTSAAVWLLAWMIFTYSGEGPGIAHRSATMILFTGLQVTILALASCYLAVWGGSGPGGSGRALASGWTYCAGLLTGLAATFIGIMGMIAVISEIGTDQFDRFTQMSTAQVWSSLLHTLTFAAVGVVLVIVAALALVRLIQAQAPAAAGPSLDESGPPSSSPVT